MRAAMLSGARELLENCCLVVRERCLQVGIEEWCSIDPEIQVIAKHLAGRAGWSVTLHQKQDEGGEQQDSAKQPCPSTGHSPIWQVHRVLLHRHSGVSKHDRVQQPTTKRYVGNQQC